MAPRLGRLNRRSGLCLCIVLALTGACVQNDGTRLNPFRKVAEVSEDDEREVGHGFDAEIDLHVQLVTDPMVNRFVHDLGQYLLSFAGPQPFVYRFRVVDDPSLNAFAVPGGYIYLHSGTILRSGSLDELAAVVAHEIAHVKGRHYARLREKSLIPDLLAAVGGIAAAAATREAGAAIAAQGANVALKLRWTREVEAESDEVGIVLMTRAGFQPLAMARFFDRILIEQERYRLNIPPYLYSHPDVEERRDVVHDRVEKLKPQREVPMSLREQFRAVQVRLSFVVASQRGRMGAKPSRFDRSRTAMLWEQAQQQAAAGEPEAAITSLREAELLEPRDPRTAARMGELLAQTGQHELAVEAFERTIALDPSNGLAYFRAGLSARRLDRAADAAFYFDQARLNFRRDSAFQERVAWENEKITFPVVVLSGLADGARAAGADTVSGHSRQRFYSDDAQVVWWARVGSRFMGDRDEIRVRWINPRGEIVQDQEVSELRRPHVEARFALRTGARETGRWIAEAWFEDDVVDRLMFELVP